MLSKYMVKIAFWLYYSKRYENTKKFFYDILENSDHAYKKFVDIFLITLIFFSIGEVIYGIKHIIPEWLHVFSFYIISIIFGIEYILRLWVHGDVHKIIIKEYERSQFLKIQFNSKTALRKIWKEKWSHIKSPTAIIDLITIIPTHRELRILRVFKLLRYSKSINQFVDVLKTKKFELITLFLLLIFLIGTAGVAFYAVEGNINKNINSLFDAVYWALISTATVGYGDIAPVTTTGKMISMIVIVTGLILIAFGTSVIVSAFLEKLGEIKDNRIIESIKNEDKFIIICGYGQMAKMLLRQNNFNNKYIILEKDPNIVQQIAKEGLNAITADASRHDVMVKFNVQYANVSVLCLGSNDVDNIYITLNVKSLSKDIKVIARASDESMKKKFTLAGADYVIVPNQMANKMLLTYINKPAIYTVMHALLAGKNAAYLDEIKVLGSDGLVGKSIQEIGFKDKKLLLIAIQKESDNDFIFNPSPSMILDENDILLIMGLKISVEYFVNTFQRGLE
ncbi:MAG: NAD-binding protein [Sulfurovaceae bacterium]|nr:NAD-binding protein [Sulfurovaceae bacterium]